MPEPRRRASIAAAALAAAMLLPACDGTAKFEGGGDGSPGPSRTGENPPTGAGFALEVSAGRVSTVRPGGELVLRFTRPLDAVAARGAVRVYDDTRGRVPIAVDAGVRGRDLALRSRDPAGWRPGAELLVAVAGMPSLRALRSEEGDALPADATVRVRVRAPRRTDRTPPSLVGSEPADAADGADPEAPVLLRFSEPMDVRALTGQSGGPRALPVAVAADGTEIPFRCFLDRTRTVLTVLPAAPLPPGASVVVELADRIRDSAGNALAAESPRRVGFRTAEGPAPAPVAGHVVEAFEDRVGMDPLGTTVRWNDPAERGVLSGIVETLALEAGAGGDSAMLLDPRGGAFRVLLPAAELGDEARVLKGLHLVAAPGGMPGEVLEPRVRIAPAPPLPAPEAVAAADLPWLDATDGLRGATARGADGALVLPFRRPFPYAGATSLVAEVSWKGVAGTVLLRATRHAEPRCLLLDGSPEPSLIRAAPVVRVEALGERAVARSIWLDSGVPSPSWQEPRVRPAAAPSRVRLLLQGAPEAADSPGPDAARATPWVAEAAALEGMRWIRFRVEFLEADPLAPPEAVDDVTLPFVAR